MILRDSTLEKDNSTENSSPVGIATERDVVTYLGSKTQPSSLETPVFEIMSHPLVTIQPNSSLKDGIETMQLRNIRRLPVIVQENGNEKMVGIVTEKDTIRAIMKALPSSQTAGEGMITLAT